MYSWCKIGGCSSNLLWAIMRTNLNDWPKWPWRSMLIQTLVNTKQTCTKMPVWWKLMMLVFMLRDTFVCEVDIWNANSLTPGKFEWNITYVIFKWILVIDGWGISCEIALIWMSLDFTNDQSTLVQVMAWCRKANSHYLNQCWPRSLSPLGHNELIV